MDKGLVTISFLGLLVSGYLFILYSSPDPIPCLSGHGCEVVRASIYSSFMSIPTPAYGVVFYLALGILGGLWSEETRKKLTLPLAVLAISGLIVSGFLTYLEAFVIHAWCSWCVASALLTLAAAAVTWKLLSHSNHQS